MNCKEKLKELIQKVVDEELSYQMEVLCPEVGWGPLTIHKKKAWKNLNKFIKDNIK